MPTEPDPASTYTSALKSARHGSRTCAPGASVAWSKAIGVQVIAAPGREDLALRVAAELELSGICAAPVSGEGTH